jgi:TIR domain
VACSPRRYPEKLFRIAHFLDSVRNAVRDGALSRLGALLVESPPDSRQGSLNASRYTLCVVSPRYISSGFCSEEAEVCKTLDMEQRRRRLVPLFLERIALPAWFGGLVGVDFATSDTAFDPYVKLKSLLNS